jgi:hypothetical protein
MHPPGEMDYSVTNSRNNYIAVCEALIAGKDALAERLATFIWDPSNASYISPRSFCTPNDQRLAYALRSLFQGEDSVAVNSALKGISLRSKAELNIRHQATMIRSLATGDRSRYLEGLDGLLAWHRKEAPSKKNFRNPEFYICIPGLGLCRLAVQRQLCSATDLPQNDEFLPLELIR